MYQRLTASRDSVSPHARPQKPVDWTLRVLSPFDRLMLASIFEKRIPCSRLENAIFSTRTRTKLLNKPWDLEEISLTKSWLSGFSR